MPHAILITYAIIMEGGVQVNRHGRRFADETRGYSEQALDVLAQPEGVVWNIYDERLHQLALQFDHYRQALDVGAVTRAATLPELAQGLGLPADGLSTTLDAYQACAAGTEVDPFGRADCRRLQGPFYGVKVTGSLFHTQGGLTVDFDARVLREDGSPIPNLYAGGGVAAGLSGHGPGGYFSGNGLLTAMGYGLLAGRHAARSVQEERDDG
jgi:fumarate reductase flavoprotein subunit